MDAKKISVIDDVVEHVRRRKAMYLGSEVVIPQDLASKLASDALASGVKSVETRRCDDWWLISSPDDWLSHDDKISLDDLFHKIVPLAGGGREAFHRTILLTAFCSLVFAKKGAQLDWIVGNKFENSTDLKICLKAIPKQNRVIGFKVDPEI